MIEVYNTTVKDISSNNVVTGWMESQCGLPIQYASPLGLNRILLPRIRKVVIL